MSPPELAIVDVATEAHADIPVVILAGGLGTKLRDEIAFRLA